MSQYSKDLDRLEWAGLGAEIFSTCGKRQYLALIFDAEGHLIGEGYNGSPPGMSHCKDGYCPRFVNDAPSFSAYGDCISTHAEANALVHSTRTPGSSLYVNGLPCWDCAKLICSAQIETLVCTTATYGTHDDWSRTRNFLEEAGVEVREYNDEGHHIKRIPRTRA